MKLISIGFGNVVVANRIVAIISPDSSPVKRLVQAYLDFKALCALEILFLFERPVDAGRRDLHIIVIHVFGKRLNAPVERFHIVQRNSAFFIYKEAQKPSGGLFDELEVDPFVPELLCQSDGDFLTHSSHSQVLL